VGDQGRTYDLLLLASLIGYGCSLDIGKTIELALHRPFFSSSFALKISYLQRKIQVAYLQLLQIRLRLPNQLIELIDEIHNLAFFQWRIVVSREIMGICSFFDSSFSVFDIPLVGLILALFTI
jgi:hypothetical protein